MPRTRVLLFALLAGALTLAGCGTTEAASDTTSASAAAAAGPVTYTDSRGKEVTLDAPAQRVVGLEWGEVEMLETLGVTPVGVADPKGYATWVTAEPLTGEVADVGTRGEPSVDAIVALDPDLIVMAPGRGNANLVQQLEKYAPVLVTAGSDAGRNLERMREDFNLIATAVGRTDRATEVLTEFDAELTRAKDAIAAAGKTDAPFAMADGWKEGSSISIRMFGQGALVSEVARELGLRNVWTGKVDEEWGLGQTDVEGLTAIDDADTRFFYNASDGEDVFAEGLAGNRVWESLPFVEAGNVTKLPDGIWTFGGPRSAQQYAQAMVDAFTA